MSLRLLIVAFGIAFGVSLAATAQDSKKPEEQSAQDATGKPTQRAGSSKDRAGAPRDKSRPGVKRTETGSDKDEEIGKDKDWSDASNKPAVETATFGGGCFWCIEAVFERVPGVKSVVSGFAGGTMPDPSYPMVCTGLTGHAEVVQIEYNPAKVSYEELLSIFFAAHDPTSLNHQGDDFGTQYRSIILYHDNAQKEAIEKTIKDLVRRHAFRSSIMTEVVPFTEFYPAEPCHQNYFRNHQDSDYSNIHIVPKLRKLSQRLK